MGKKADKMYSDSPSIKKSEKTGNSVVKKPSESSPPVEAPTEATKEDIGLSGNPLPGANEGGLPIDVHIQERTEVAKRHLQELKDMYKRHESEYDTMHKRHHGSTESSNKEDK